jgi:hypothetical protein
MQVWGQPGRVILAERVVIVCVATDRSVEEAVEGLRLGLAAAGGSPTSCSSPSAPRDGSRPGEPGRQGGSSRGAVSTSAGHLEPAAMEREKTVGLAVSLIVRTSTALRPWCARSSAPASRSVLATRSPLRRRLTSCVT